MMYTCEMIYSVFLVEGTGVSANQAKEKAANALLKAFGSTALASSKIKSIKIDFDPALPKDTDLGGII